MTPCPVLELNPLAPWPLHCMPAQCHRSERRSICIHIFGCLRWPDKHFLTLQRGIYYVTAAGAPLPNGTHRPRHSVPLLLQTGPCGPPWPLTSPALCCLCCRRLRAICIWRPSLFRGGGSGSLGSFCLFVGRLNPMHSSLTGPPCTVALLWLPLPSLCPPTAYGSSHRPPPPPPPLSPSVSYASLTSRHG